MSYLSVLSQWANNLKRYPTSDASNILNTMEFVPGGVLSYWDTASVDSVE